MEGILSHLRKNGLTTKNAKIFKVFLRVLHSFAVEMTF